MSKCCTIKKKKKPPQIRFESALLVAQVFFLLILGLFALSTVVFAANTTDAEYQGIVRITNNSTAETAVSVNCSIWTQVLIDAGYINTSCNNTATLTPASADIAYMPAVGSNNSWAFWIPSIANRDVIDYRLYTGGTTDMAGKIRYFPGSGGMTTADSVSLELGDNFTIEQKGWIDTANGTDKNLVYKQAAFSTSISPTVSGNISSDIILSNDEAIQDSYEGSDDAGAQMFGVRWYAQTFTTNSTYMITKVEINLIKILAPAGNLDILIRNTSDNGSPMGSGNLTYGSIVANSVPAGPGWVTIDLTDYKLTPNVKYALIASVPDGIATDYLRWRLDNTVPSYTGGSYFESLDSGATWTPDTGFDHLFRVYGYPIISVTAAGISSGEKTITTQATDNSTIWATGSVFDFDGAADSNVDCGLIHNGATKLWVSLWFKLDASFPDGTSPYVISKRTGGTERFDIQFINATGVLQFTVRTVADGTVTLNSAETSWNANQGYHVIFSTSDAAGKRLRINGGTAVTDANVVIDVTNGGNFVIGDKEVGSGQGITGNIANVIVGTDDLSPDEEKALYNGTSPGDQVHYWFIDEGTGTNIVDYGSDGDDGTAGRATSWATSTHTGSDYTGRLTSFALGIDGIKTGNNDTAKTSIPVPGNSANWTFIENGVMLYMEDQDISVNGTQVQYIEWENSATFSDNTSYSNDATPTFRVTSSDPHVSAKLISFKPIAESEATGWDVTLASTMIGAPTPGAGPIPEMFTENVTAHLPGAGFFNAMIVAGGVSWALFWIPFSFILIIVIGILTHGATRSLGFQAAIMAFGLAFFATLGPIPFVPVIIFVIDSTAVIMMSKQIGW